MMIAELAPSWIYHKVSLIINAALQYNKFSEMNADNVQQMFFNDSYQ